MMPQSGRYTVEDLEFMRMVIAAMRIEGRTIDREAEIQTYIAAGIGAVELGAYAERIGALPSGTTAAFYGDKQPDASPGKPAAEGGE